MTGYCFLADRATEYVVRPTQTVYLDLGGGRKQAVVEQGIRFQFEAIREGVPCSKISSKDRSGKAFGYLSVDKASEDSGWTPQEVIDYFTTGKMARYYGVKFVLADEEGNPVDLINDRGYTLEERQAKRDSGEDSDYIVKGTDARGDTLFHCKACDKNFKKGQAGHARSKKHLENVARLKKPLASKLAQGE